MGTKIIRYESMPNFSKVDPVDWAKKNIGWRSLTRGSPLTVYWSIQVESTTHFGVKLLKEQVIKNEVEKYTKNILSPKSHARKKVQNSCRLVFLWKSYGIWNKVWFKKCFT